MTAEMTPLQQLQAYRDLVNQVQGDFPLLAESEVRCFCSELYRRRLQQRTWERWKSMVLATNKPWNYADSVCLRFVAIGRAGNGERGGHRRFGVQELNHHLYSFLTADDPESLFIPPGPSTGWQVEQILRSATGKQFTQRHCRNLGIYRRKTYTSAQIEHIITNLVA